MLTDQTTFEEKNNNWIMVPTCRYYQFHYIKINNNLTCSHFSAPNVIVIISVCAACALVIMVGVLVCIIQCKKSRQNKLIQRHDSKLNATLQSNTYRHSTLPNQAYTSTIDNRLCTLESTGDQVQEAQHPKPTAPMHYQPDNVDYLNYTDNADTWCRSYRNQPKHCPDTMKIRGLQEPNEECEFQQPKYYVLDRNLIG